MLTPGRDDVSNIHRRWSFTRINPSSSKISYAIWIACAVIIVVISHVYYLQASMAGLVIFLPLGITSLLGSHVLDYVALRRTPGNKLSKIAHVSAFANILWALTVVLGVAADFVFSKPPGMNYVIAGMLLAVGLRIDILTSVFGASTRRAIIVSFIQPLIFLLAFVPPSFFYSVLINSFVGLGFGAIFIALAIVWALIADKAGRPGVKSTFVLMQAFLVAWTENRVDMMEDFLEAKAHDSLVTTRVIRFFSAGNDAAIVLPDVHPGPFSAVGGSNLPYVLYERFSKRALIMHSISDHSLNIPSKRLLEKYLKDLGRMRAVKTGDTCSAPVQVKINNSTSTGIAFGNSAIVMLSLAPNGMEDIPQSVRGELESYGGSLGFPDVLVVDCHNAMGKNLQDSDRTDLVESAKRCLEELKKQPQKGFKVGFASLDNIQHRVARTDELGSGGLAILVICVDDRNYAIGWADSNNMENKLRDYVISKVRDNVTMLEVCSSDTHSTSGKRTREGYFALGTTSNPQDIAETYVELCAKAIEMAAKSTFELASTQSAIRVMGKKLFEDVSSALDRSMNVTKIFVAITVATYIAMLVLS
jgi:putative membrane protein